MQIFILVTDLRAYHEGYDIFLAALHHIKLFIKTSLSIIIPSIKIIKFHHLFFTSIKTRLVRLTPALLTPSPSYQKRLKPVIIT